jgi:predicted RNA methylase
MRSCSGGALDDLLRAAPSDVKRAALSQWYTDGALAKRIVEWSGVHEYSSRFPARTVRLLEPACGEGAILLHVPPAVHVTAYDIDPVNAEIVRHQRPSGDLIGRGDFLRVPRGPRFDFAITNPPYEDNLDVKFLLRCSEDASRTIALVRLTTFVSKGRYRDLWPFVEVKRIAFLASRPDFGGDHGAKADFVVLELVRRPRVLLSPKDRPTVEWWSEDDIIKTEAA